MDAKDVNGGAERDEDHGADRLEQVEFVTHVEGEARVEKGDGDDDEFGGHEVSQDVIDDFEDRPLFRLHQAPGARGEHERVPCGDGERADEKVLVGGEVRREIEVRREERGNIEACAHDRTDDELLLICLIYSICFRCGRIGGWEES
jgi:hypothetical protein